VVDNDSKDGSDLMIHESFPQVRLIRSGGNIGFGRASNLGVQVTNSPFVLFINPDTVVRDGAIDRMVALIMNNQEVGAIGCGLIYPDGKLQPLGLQWFPTPATELLNLFVVSEYMPMSLKRRLAYKDPFVSGYVSKLYGGCLLVRRSILDQLGCFDERFFMYCEDVDLCRRIIDAGWKLYYLREAEVVHFVGGASSKSYSQFSTLMKCQSICQLMEKYYGKMGASLYRLGVFFGSQWRIILLLTICILNKSLNFKKNIKIGQAMKKYWAMLGWSLGLSRAAVKS
jgi:GT2 family glycosyltransferase